jgi:hypothetical protein
VVVQEWEVENPITINAKDVKSNKEASKQEGNFIYE